MRSLLIKAPASSWTSIPKARGAIFTRTYAVQAPGAPTVEVFDGRTKWLQKERAARNERLRRAGKFLSIKFEFREEADQKLINCL